MARTKHVARKSTDLPEKDTSRARKTAPDYLSQHAAPKHARMSAPIMGPPNRRTKVATDTLTTSKSAGAAAEQGLRDRVDDNSDDAPMGVTIDEGGEKGHLQPREVKQMRGRLDTRLSKIDHDRKTPKARREPKQPSPVKRSGVPMLTRYYDAIHEAHQLAEIEADLKVMEEKVGVAPRPGSVLPSLSTRDSPAFADAVKLFESANVFRIAANKARLATLTQDEIGADWNKDLPQEEQEEITAGTRARPQRKVQSEDVAFPSISSRRTHESTSRPEYRAQLEHSEYLRAAAGSSRSGEDAELESEVTDDEEEEMFVRPAKRTRR